MCKVGTYLTLRLLSECISFRSSPCYVLIITDKERGGPFCFMDGGSALCKGTWTRLTVITEPEPKLNLV